MGKALRPEHLEFFANRMNEHDRVISWQVIPSDEEFLFQITRRVGSSNQSLVVHLTDSYRYGLAEFYARPRQLRRGAFVVIGMPHADASEEVIEEAKNSQIGIGHIGKFMGALNYRKVWEYITPEEQARKAKESQQGKVEG